AVAGQAQGKNRPRRQAAPVVNSHLLSAANRLRCPPFPRLWHGLETMPQPGRASPVLPGDAAVAHRWTCLLLAALCLATLAPAAEPAGKARQKLYVTNSAGDDVSVLDVAT